ncbi:MAG: methyl-accepting chemotaxis protein [Spirochaetales bacterium]|nr:methyl-accepting chemotaxis protein [Spirochaetales bacterium]
MSSAPKNGKTKKIGLSRGLILLGSLVLLPFIAFPFLEPGLLTEHSTSYLTLLGISLMTSVLLLLQTRGKLRQFGKMLESLRKEESPSFEPYGELKKLFTIVINLYQKEKGATQKMDQYCQELIESSVNYGVSTDRLPEMARTQKEQLRDMLSGMEDRGELFQNISHDFEEIYRITLSLKEAFLSGFELVGKSLRKMDEIESSNRDTLKGILFLSERIEKIWEIIKMINQITDQTKIIAFNAELEAAAAGDAGKNFQIVAAEIRRLADSTISSTNEIRGKITEIQHSSDNLIISSENGTELISEGNKLSKELEKIFEEVLHSTEIAASSTEEISHIFQEQVTSSGEVLEKLRQATMDMEELSRLTDQVKVSYEALNSASEFSPLELEPQEIELKG